MATRNPVRVLPVPVGEATSTSPPSAIRGQAARWGSVGPPGKRPRNHPATAGMERAQDGVGGQRVEVGRWRPAPGTGRSRGGIGRDEVEGQGLGIGPVGPAPGPAGRQGGGHVSIGA